MIIVSTIPRGERKREREREREREDNEKGHNDQQNNLHTNMIDIFKHQIQLQLDTQKYLPIQNTLSLKVSGGG